MRNGVCWERPTLERVTIENGFGYLPTIHSQEPGWKHIEVVDKDGNPPKHHNQRFYDKRTGRLVQKGLTQVIKMWPTPIRRDSRSFKGAARGPNALGTEPLTVQVGGTLNPTWVEWLMGWPLGWTDLKPLGTDRFREWFERFGI